PLDDAALNERLLRLRTQTGQRILSKHSALRPTIKALRAGETVGILMDQNTVRREA
ncbi:MAG: lipid A biosynthesis acyltransferase, partial [Gammaproteobacteria bacterium]|nr:lipid A biosynthesis acyltransferase [Gammaproteobacteria bacterium]